jgi:hypothetical protein
MFKKIVWAGAGGVIVVARTGTRHSAAFWWAASPSGCSTSR